MKCQKVLSFLLAAAVGFSAVLTGLGATAEEAAIPGEDGNYLYNGGFESLETIEKGEKYGYADVVIGRGQNNPLADGWMGFNWWANDDKETAVRVSHTIDAHSGDYALKFAVRSNSDPVTVYPTVISDKLEPGDYTLSVWVKGSNTASTLNAVSADGTVRSVNLPASDDWQQISIDGITVGEEFGKTTVDGKQVIGITLKITKDSGNPSELYVDDIRLEKSVATASELLINGSFEDAGDRGQDYSNYTVSSGQGNIIAAGWHGQAWSPIPYTVSHATDSHDGKYALRLDARDGGSGNYSIYPSVSSVVTGAITTGRYALSVWVKGTAETAKLQFGTQSVAIPAGEAWHQVTLYDIDLTPDYAFTTENNVNNIPMNKSIAVSVGYQVGAYLVIDGLSLKKQELLYNGEMEINGITDDTTSANGQEFPNKILQGYTIVDWSNKKNTIQKTDDAHSGSQAIRIDAITSSTYFYSRYDGTELAPGNYRFSVWMKGTGRGRLAVQFADENAPTVQVGSTAETVVQCSEEEWTYVTLDFTVAEGRTLRRRTEYNSTTLYYNFLYFGVNNDNEKYVIFDDLNLVKLTSAADAAAAITGIDAPEKGAAALSLPDCGENIKVTVASSSNEAVIATDGTVTPPLFRTFVDVTLRLDDGKTQAETAPIRVLVPGTKQSEIDAVALAVFNIPQYVTPADYGAYAAARRAYNALSAEEQAFVVNRITLGERKGVLQNYLPAVQSAAVTADGDLRLLSLLPEGSYEGFTLQSYGVVFLPAALLGDGELTLETSDAVYTEITLAPTEADSIYFADLTGSGLNEQRAGTEIATRAYAVYTYSGGTVTVYSENTDEALTVADGVLCTSVTAAK